jgi:hypothetical protein
MAMGVKIIATATLRKRIAVLRPIDKVDHFGTSAAPADV